MIKIAIIISHPIQHFCPMYASWAEFPDWEIMVFFASTIGLESFTDHDFGATFRWEGLQLNFPYVFLNTGKQIDISNNIDAVDLYDQLDQYCPNVIVVYGYIQRLQRRAINYGLKNNIKLLMISDSELRQHRPLYKKVTKKIILTHYFRKIDGFLTVGDSNEDYYQFYGVEPYRLFRSPFPINRDYFDQFIADKKHYRHAITTKHRIPEDNIIVAVVGKLVPWKRQKDIIDALYELEDTKKPITALIIGSGSDQEQLVQLSKSINKKHQVIFTGFVQPVDLPKYYLATDIYLHPSEVDRHSLAISEASYMGCPILLSDRCGSYGPCDDVQPGRNGFVYPCGDIKSLSYYLKYLINTPELRKRFSRNSREIAVNSQRLAHGEGLKSAITALGLHSSALKL
ncbi:MAG: glycosyltransferase [Candidatus Competibacteraceae bacterium]